MYVNRLFFNREDVRSSGSRGVLEVVGIVVVPVQAEEFTKLINCELEVSEARNSKTIQFHWIAQYFELATR